MNGSISGATSITATGEVSTDNAMFSVDATNITGDRGFEAYYSDKRIFCGFGSSGNYGIYTEAGGWIMSMHGSHVAIAKDSGHNVGIGTTTPAYKLDVNGSIRATSGFTGTLSGNASSATKLATARTITIGNTSKNFDGSANVSWTLSEIGAASSGHTHTTSASSNATTNLSITAGGTTATITDLYANYATSAGSVAWGNVTGKPSWIGSSKPSYSWSEITSKPSSFTPSAHTHDYLSGWSDTRGTAETPNSYNGVFEVKGIKQSSTYGISSGSYVQVFGYRGWSDSSGGRAHEFALADNGRIYHRDGSTTSWDSWDTVAYLSDIPSLSGYATQSWVKSQGYLTSAPSYSTATASKDGLVRIGFPESGKNYPVELNSNHQMYVNVPWTDTNTTYSLTKSGNTITLTGSDGKTTSVTDSNTTYSNATTSAAGLMSAADKTKLNNTPTFSYSNGVLTITT